MRIDRFFSEVGKLSRTECAAALKKGRITVNGETVKFAKTHIDEKCDVVKLDGETVVYRTQFYIMLNKPAGTVSSTEEAENTVMKLLPKEYSKMNGFPCGRLDIDTVGLLLITNDGDCAHRLLSPKHHVTKTYRFSCETPLDCEAIKKLECGVDLGDFVSLPAKVKLFSPTEGEISIEEGKFHQIKRMIAEVGSKITYLERIKFGPLTLDENLPRGQWRELTEGEIDALTRQA